MKTLRILHAADMHLDSPFEGLSSGKASIRRSEQRELLSSMAELANAQNVQLVLLAGDLLDSDNSYYETGEELYSSLALINAPVFISPGNHDYYSPKSAYARFKLPDNVHVFSSSEITCVELEDIGVRVFGAGFTENRSPALLESFQAEKLEGVFNVMCIHGDVGLKDSRYNPISEAQIATSGMDYIALGHVHRASGLLKAGACYYSYSGCTEGRGFDECGEKTLNIVSLSEDSCELTKMSISKRRYETLSVDISETEPLLAIHTALPDDTVKDIYRICLTGEADTSPDLKRLYLNLEEMFFDLKLKDETRLRHNLWEYAGDDSLRGLFLKKLRLRFDASNDEGERQLIEQAARWGIAALDNMEEVARHEDQ